MQRVAFRAMGCNVSAIVHAHSAQAKLGATILLACVQTWFIRWEKCLSRFQPTSELCRLNCTHDTWHPISNTLWQVLVGAMHSARWTEGLVTPTILGALEAVGYDRSFDLLERLGPAQSAPPSPTPIHREAMAIPLFERIRLDPDRRCVYLPHPLRLDLSGFAKGWAADQVCRRLKRFGAVLVDVGGDIATSGTPMQLAWPIGITSPFSPQHKAVQLPGGLSIATSGRDYRCWMQGTQVRHHIVNPHTGQSADTDVMTATVIAPTTQQAEAAAKATLILGSEQGMRWLESNPVLAGLFFLADGSQLVSRNMNRYLRD